MIIAQGIPLTVKLSVFMRFLETKAQFDKAFYEAADIEHDCESIRPRELKHVCAAFLVSVENMIKTVKGEQP